MECEYSYSAYGTRTVVNGYESVIGYCGRDGVLTENGGLCYMRARYYSPELMRFVNQDIIVGDISNSNSLNRYTYVEGNPATMVDPFGLCPVKPKCVMEVNSWLKMYSGPTIDGQCRIVSIPSEADKSKWAMREGLGEPNPINYWAKKIIEDSNEVIIGECGEVVDDSGRYYVAVGPNVMNPEHSSSKKITAEEMNYGAFLDVVITDEDGNEYYIPCTVGDAKAHTYPSGIVQTGNGFPDGCDPHPQNNDGSIIEFCGKGSISGLTKYQIKEIRVY